MNERGMLDARRMCATVLVALTTLAVRGPATHLAAQSPPAPEPRFEVASVKPSPSPSDLIAESVRAAGGGRASLPSYGIRRLPGGRFIASAVTLKQLIVQAFDVKDYQLEGGPKWLSSEYFAVNASAGGEATPAEMNAMLKALLADRFSLRAHIETRQAPMHALTILRSDSKLGSGLKPTSPECVQLIEARKNGTAGPPQPRSTSGGLPTAPTCGVVTGVSRGNGVSTTMYGGMELKELVSSISYELSAPVVDQTGLTGLFDITIEYSSQRQTAGRPAGLDPNSNDTPPPPMAIAVEKQLGLKLEKQLGPLPFVVIDSAEHPTAD